MPAPRWVALWPLLLVAAGALPAASALRTRERAPLGVRVTFLDGSTVTLQHPRLVYTWSSWSTRQFVDATTVDTEVIALHYATGSSGRRVDHAIPLDSVGELRFAYRTLAPPAESEPTIIRQSMIVTLRGGRRITIDQPLFGGLDNFLPTSLTPLPADSLLFERLSLRGEREGPGRPATATFLLLGAGAPANDRYLPRQERANEACHSCRLRSAIVQRANF